MAFLDSLAPKQPVNKGLAYTGKPLYPDIIGMINKKADQDLKKGELDYQKKKDVSAYWSSKEMDYDGSSPESIDVTQGLVGGLQEKASTEGVNPILDSSFDMAFGDIKANHQKMNSYEGEVRNVNALIKNGTYSHLDEAVVSEQLYSAQTEYYKKVQDAIAKGESPLGIDFSVDDIVNNIENWDKTAVYKKGFAEFLEQTTNTYQTIRSGDETQVSEFEVNQADIFERKDNGDPILDPATGLPQYKDALSDEALLFITSNQDGVLYKSINDDWQRSLDAGEDITFNQQAMRSLQQSGLGVSKQTGYDVSTTTKGDLTTDQAARLGVDTTVYNLQYALNTGNKEEFNRQTKNASNKNVSLSAESGAIGTDGTVYSGNEDFVKDADGNITGVRVKGFKKDAEGNIALDDNDDKIRETKIIPVEGSEVISIKVRKTYFSSNAFYNAMQGNSEMSEIFDQRKDLEGGEYTQVAIPFNSDSKDVVLDMLAQSGYTEKYKDVALSASNRAITDATAYNEAQKDKNTSNTRPEGNVQVGDGGITEQHKTPEYKKDVKEQNDLLKDVKNQDAEILRVAASAKAPEDVVAAALEIYMGLGAEQLFEDWFNAGGRKAAEDSMTTEQETAEVENEADAL